MSLNCQQMKTRAGELTLVSDGEHLLSVEFSSSKMPGTYWGQPLVNRADAVLDLAGKELAEYFSGNRKTFTVPYLLSGTPFQKEVWQQLARIPYGQTVSYGELAVRIDRPRACRAVGQANNKNPLAIIIPCHRVIGKDGSLVGYGAGLDKKAWLLDFEQNKIT